MQMADTSADTAFRQMAIFAATYVAKVHPDRYVPVVCFQQNLAAHDRGVRFDPKAPFYSPRTLEQSE